MKHIEHNLKSIKRRIMLRVYYSYGLSLLSRTAFAHGLVLGGLIALFGRLTHVAAITDNLMHVPVASVPTYIWQTLVGALAGGEVLTVFVTIGGAGLTVLAAVRLGTLAAELHHKEMTV